jgi:hypothetical protein
LTAPQEKGQLGRLIRELSVVLGEDPAVQDHPVTETSEPEHKRLQILPGLLSVDGHYSGRAVSVGFGGTGELHVQVQCIGKGRFRVLPGRKWRLTPGFMQGRKVRSGNADFDRMVTVRNQASIRLEGWLSEGSVRDEIELLMPFDSVVYSGSSLRFNGAHTYSTTSREILRRIESLNRLALSLEKTFADQET